MSELEEMTKQRDAAVAEVARLAHRVAELERENEESRLSASRVRLNWQIAQLTQQLAEASKSLTKERALHSQTFAKLERLESKLAEEREENRLAETGLANTRDEADGLALQLAEAKRYRDECEEAMFGLYEDLESLRAKPSGEPDTRERERRAFEAAREGVRCDCGGEISAGIWPKYDDFDAYLASLGRKEES